MALIFTASQAQEAQIERIPIYEDEKGIVYLNKTFYVNEESSPVQINGVTIRHIPGKTVALAEAYYNALFQYLSDEEKQHLRKLAKETLTITIDADGVEVVAVKFGIIVYDAFEEFLGGLTGITMEPPTVGMTWEHNPTYLFKFEKYGVVGIYVRQARLKDGRIWNFDEELVTDQFSAKLGELTREQVIGSNSPMVSP